tara:strand:+ start:810 stop:1253 length:444 start_codon:yes stop_codon:yes gene_type:complete
VAGLGRLYGSGGEGPSTVIFRHDDAGTLIERELVGAQAHRALFVVGVHGCDAADQDDAAIEVRFLLEHVLHQLDGVQPIAGVLVKQLQQLLHALGKDHAQREGVAWVGNACNDAPSLEATGPVRFRFMQPPLGAPEVLVDAVPKDVA